MGARMSRRSADITTPPKDGEPIAVPEEGEGKLGQLEDPDRLKANLTNGDAHVEKEKDEEKNGDEATEPITNGTASESDEAKTPDTDKAVKNNDNEGALVNGDGDKATDKTEEQPKKKSKLKTWLLNKSQSFTKRDKQKNQVAKKKEDGENIEEEDVKSPSTEEAETAVASPETEVAEATTTEEKAAEEPAKEVKAPAEPAPVTETVEEEKVAPQAASSPVKNGDVLENLTDLSEAVQEIAKVRNESFSNVSSIPSSDPEVTAQPTPDIPATDHHIDSSDKCHVVDSRPTDSLQATQTHVEHVDAKPENLPVSLTNNLPVEAPIENGHVNDAVEPACPTKPIVVAEIKAANIINAETKAADTTPEILKDFKSDDLKSSIVKDLILNGDGINADLTVGFVSVEHTNGIEKSPESEQPMELPPKTKNLQEDHSSVDLLSNTDNAEDDEEDNIYDCVPKNVPVIPDILAETTSVNSVIGTDETINEIENTVLPDPESLEQTSEVNVESLPSIEPPSPIPPNESPVQTETSVSPLPPPELEQNDFVTEPLTNGLKENGHGNYDPNDTDFPKPIENVAENGEGDVEPAHVNGLVNGDTHTVEPIPNPCDPVDPIPYDVEQSETKLENGFSSRCDVMVVSDVKLAEKRQSAVSEDAPAPVDTTNVVESAVTEAVSTVCESNDVAIPDVSNDCTEVAAAE